MNALAHQFLNACSCNAVSPKFYLLALFMGLFQLPADAAALALLLQQQVDVVNDRTLLLWCIIGSSGGAYCGVFLFPPAKSKVYEDDEPSQLIFLIRRLCAKFGFALIVGSSITPMIVRMTHMPVDGTSLLGCSTVVAFAVVALVHCAANLLDSYRRRQQIIYNITNNGPAQQQLGSHNNQDQSP